EMKSPLVRSASSALLAWVAATSIGRAEPTAMTPPEPPSPTPSVKADPLMGLVINRTVTVLGKDFYKYFAARWRILELSTRFSVTVHERPTAQRGSEIWVQFGQQRVFHTFLSPRRSAVRKVSDHAAQ